MIYRITEATSLVMQGEHLPVPEEPPEIDGHTWELAGVSTAAVFDLRTVHYTFTWRAKAKRAVRKKDPVPQSPTKSE